MNKAYDLSGDLQPYFDSIAHSAPLSSKEEREASERIKTGDTEERNRLVEANLRFVVDVAKKYQNRGLPLQDLIAAGNLGLMTAAERFDGEKGFKFISYAVWWIRQAILQAIATEARGIRLPLNQLILLNKMGRAQRKLYGESNGETPSAGDVAEEIGTGGEEEVSNILLKARYPVSLDEPVGEDGNSALVENFPDSNAHSDIGAMDQSGKEAVQKALRKLPPREARILTMYFGLDGSEPMTLEEIGAVFGLTRERVRQLKNRALGTLKRRFGKVLGSLFYEHEPTEVAMGTTPQRESLRAVFHSCTMTYWQYVRESLQATGINSVNQLQDMNWRELPDSIAGCDDAVKAKVKLIAAMLAGMKAENKCTLVEAKRGVAQIAKSFPQIEHHEVYFAPDLVDLFKKKLEASGNNVQEALDMITDNQYLQCEIAEYLLLFERQRSSLKTGEGDNLSVLSGRKPEKPEERGETMHTTWLTDWSQLAGKKAYAKLLEAFPTPEAFEDSVTAEEGKVYKVCMKYGIVSGYVFRNFRDFLERRGNITLAPISAKTLHDRDLRRLDRDLRSKGRYGTATAPDAVPPTPTPTTESALVVQPAEKEKAPRTARLPREDAMVMHHDHQAGDDLARGMITMLSQASQGSGERRMGPEVDLATRAGIIMAPLSMLVREFSGLILLGPSARAIEMIDEDSRLKRYITQNPDFSSVLALAKAVVKVGSDLSGTPKENT